METASLTLLLLLLLLPRKQRHLCLFLDRRRYSIDDPVDDVEEQKGQREELSRQFIDTPRLVATVHGV